MKFRLEIRSGRPEIDQFATRLRESVVQAGGSVSADRADTPDMILAVGGDGTMLTAVKDALEWDIPVLGFNLGTLGFLTEAEPDDLDKVVHRLLEADYEVVERLTVSADIASARAIGVNDVVVEKIDTTRLVNLEVAIDGARFATYRADGLIVATPTGSTAYSFSAGGPVIDPDVPALVLTPVAAHSLFHRSVVIPASAEVHITVRRDRPVRVNVDKAVLGHISDGDEVIVRRGDRPAKFVTFRTTTFPGLVRDKFRLD